MSFYFYLDLGRRLARLPARSFAQLCLYPHTPAATLFRLPVYSGLQLTAYHLCLPHARPSIQATPMVTHRDNPIIIYIYLFIFLCELLVMFCRELSFDFVWFAN